MADDIVTRLRSEHRMALAPLHMSDAADEIERLRALIRFYADAHDGITLNWSVDRKGNWCLFDAADKALLKEARRGCRHRDPTVRLRLRWVRSCRTDRTTPHRSTPRRWTAVLLRAV